MKCKESKEQFTGIYNFVSQIKGEGKGVINEEGKEYFVDYNEEGTEIKGSRNRTFEGIRLMIIGNRF